MSARPILRTPGFNPRARVGRDSPRAPLQGIGSRFNPRARVGRDDIGRVCGQVELQFQSTRPRGARRPESRTTPAWQRFQSTRPRGARRGRYGVPERGGVSIHAPAWGATFERMPGKLAEEFQSTRPRGARLGKHTPLASSYLFQSTRPRGARPAPDGGPGSSSGFNPRARVGRDTPITAPVASRMGFQSTRPRGARRGIYVDSRRYKSFNPRARVGRDIPRPALYLREPRVSIHAPAWGATDSTGSGNQTCEFQSTRPRGARPSCVFHCATVARFQSTRPRGARPAATPPSPSPKCFNPRARVGRDSACRRRRFRSGSFNPRARVGRDQPLAGHEPVDSGFQSTRPRGARRGGRDHQPGSLCFNPRARVGRDSPPWCPAPARWSFNPRARVGRDGLSKGAIWVH